jgi:tRNA nucleotidyltransferase (CCA-adding enzyme)
MAGGVGPLMRDPDEILWPAGLEIAGRLVNAGHTAFLVGGCVRDRLMGRKLHDIDIATSALPEQVMGLFARTVPTGLKHGTVTVIENGRAFEVTTYRREFGYSDARRPDLVSFVTDIRDDLSRRDFTINAMAVGLDGELVDPFGGRVDLDTGIIQCVGDASERFGEDALRMLRAIRFGAEFGFRLSPSVWKGILSQAPRLKQVAMERVGAEWDRMMAGSGPDQACDWLLRSGLPEHFKERPPTGLLEHDSVPVNLAPIRDPDLRWAALLIGMGLSVEEITAFCRQLRFSGRRISRISNVAEFSRSLSNAFTRELWIRAVLDIGAAAANDWLVIRSGKTEAVSEAAQWLADMPLTAVSGLAVKGDELALRLNRAPGPWVAELLHCLAGKVAIGQLSNDKPSLLEAAEQTIDK